MGQARPRDQEETLMSRLRASARALLVSALFGSLFGSLGGCSSLSAPALRHETGEALGTGRLRVRLQTESARLFPLVPSGSAPFSVPQSVDVFQGGLLGVQADGGIAPLLDAQFGTFYPVGGGGWRLGAKYQLLKKRFAVAAMGGYSRLATQGSVTYTTASGVQDFTQTFSGYRIDFGVPVSYRLGAASTLFGGLTYFRSGVRGSSGSGYVSSVDHDIGVNLGFKLNFGRFEGDLEFALQRLNDPFEQSNRYVPFWGLAGGILF
jgi:hypothetical protein